MNLIEMRDRIDKRVRRQRVWAAADFSKWLPADVAEAQLEELCDTGDLVPFRPGQYYRGRKLKDGMRLLGPMEVAQVLYGRPGVGFTGFEAAVNLGITRPYVDGKFHDYELGYFDASDPKCRLHIAVPSATVEDIPGAVLTHRDDLPFRVSEGLNEVQVSFLETLANGFAYADDEVRAWWRLGATLTDGVVRRDRLERALEHESNISRTAYAEILHHLEEKAKWDAMEW